MTAPDLHSLRQELAKTLGGTFSAASRSALDAADVEALTNSAWPVVAKALAEAWGDAKEAAANVARKGSSAKSVHPVNRAERQRITFEIAALPNPFASGDTTNGGTD